jgi:hypothetical protein
MPRSVATNRGRIAKNQMEMERRTKMNFTKYIGTSVLSVALVLAAGVSCLAKNSESVTLSRNVIVNGTTLPAGHYTVRWDDHNPEATVVFSQRRKVVLSTGGTVLTRKGNYRSMTMTTPDKASEVANVHATGAVVYNTAGDGTISLVEIRFATSDKVLVFNQ